MTTLTYDSSESAPGELNAEEQDSLAVGEKMEAEQSTMLAGKFKDAESLESAYLELQKKLGSSAETDTQETTESKPEPEPAQETGFLDTLWTEAQNGVTKETQEKLSAMDPSDLANMYLEYRSNVEQQQASAQPQEFSEEVVNTLQQSAGGEKQYRAMLDWASQNLNQQEIDMYDQVMERGDPQAAFFAIQAIKYRYNDAVGTDGKLLTGKAAAESKDVYRSQAELVQAMSDPRYDSDPAYRADVLAKLDRSDINF